VDCQADNDRPRSAADVGYSVYIIIASEFQGLFYQQFSFRTRNQYPGVDFKIQTVKFTVTGDISGRFALPAAFNQFKKRAAFLFREFLKD
jgi:hypothetical protein